MKTSTEVLAARADAVARGVSHVTSVVCDRAQNAEIWDLEGRRYIDFAAGIAVCNTGHNHPDVKAAVIAQLDRFTHTSFNVAMYPQYVELAQRLNALVPGSSPRKTILVSTGAEAVENAVKVARVATGRSAVIAFSAGFHGRTMMTMALTGKVTPYKAGFGPFPAEVFHARFPDEAAGVTVEDSIASIHDIFHEDVDPARVAAIIIEPVQGEGGFNIASVELLQALRKLCDDHGILLIIDEIQTGFGRTGAYFAHARAGIEADIITMAKGIAGGYPLAAVTGRADLMDASPVGGLGGTYAGSPVACAAALAVLDVIDREELCARAEAIGQTIEARLVDLRQRARKGVIGAIRRLGAMVAVELCSAEAPHTADAALTRALIAEAQKQGLILISCGTKGNVIRFLMPLTIPDAHLEEGLTILEQSLTALDVLAPRLANAS